MVVKVSARSSAAVQSVNLRITFNGTTGNRSSTRLNGSGSAATSDRYTSDAVGFNLKALSGGSSTANTFGSLELYIPNYTGSTNKPFSAFGVSETNATAAEMGVGAALWSNTSAISSVLLFDSNSGNWESGSTFHLYGISNT